MTAIEIAREALAEDAREGSHFDATSFAQFNPEEDPETVREAWVIYDDIVFGGKDRSVFGV